MESESITALLHDWGHGRRENEEQLFAMVYPQLRSIAGALFQRERENHLLQPTGVVNELFLRLIQQRRLEFNDREHFYSFAARVMRRVLVDHARTQLRVKRDGGVAIDLSEGMLWVDADLEQALDVERAFAELETIDARKCRMAELRFLIGFTAEETGQLMQMSKASVDRDLRFVRGWLHHRLGLPPS